MKLEPFLIDALAKTANNAVNKAIDSHERNLDRQKELVEALRSMLGIKADVTLVAPKSIIRSEGKAVRVIDNRKI